LQISGSQAAHIAALIFAVQSFCEHRQLVLAAFASSLPDSVTPVQLQ